MVGVTPSSIRYWENCFEELTPQKSSKGTRLFTKENIETVKFIHHLVKERGLTIKGVQQKLKNNRNETLETWEIVKRLQFVKKELLDIRNEMED